MQWRFVGLVPVFVEDFKGGLGVPFVLGFDARAVTALVEHFRFPDEDWSTKMAANGPPTAITDKI